MMFNEYVFLKYEYIVDTDIFFLIDYLFPEGDYTEEENFLSDYLEMIYDSFTFMDRVKKKNLKRIVLYKVIGLSMLNGKFDFSKEDLENTYSELESFIERPTEALVYSKLVISYYKSIHDTTLSVDHKMMITSFYNFLMTRWSISDVIRCVNKGFEYILEIILGENHLSPKDVLSICSYFDCTVNDVVGKRGSIRLLNEHIDI